MIMQNYGSVKPLNEFLQFNFDKKKKEEQGKYVMDLLKDIEEGNYDDLATKHMDAMWNDLQAICKKYASHKGFVVDNYSENDNGTAKFPVVIWYGDPKDSTAKSAMNKTKSELLTHVVALKDCPTPKVDIENTEDGKPAIVVSFDKETMLKFYKKAYGIEESTDMLDNFRAMAKELGIDNLNSDEEFKKTAASDYTKIVDKALINKDDSYEEKPASDYTKLEDDENSDPNANGKDDDYELKESSTVTGSIEDVEPMTAEEILKGKPDDGICPSLVQFINEDRNFVTDPQFNKIVSEYFDYTDRTTAHTLCRLNEAGQNTVIQNLTNKLYDNIVKKCDDIDYGEIPKTKGDITKLSNYGQMKECIELLHKLLKEYRQDTGPIDELSVALGNIEGRADLFERAYRYNMELPMAMYCNVTLSIIAGISYMIATCIEFIKKPNDDSFNITLDQMAYRKTKDHLIYSTLKKFNKSCQTKEFDRAMETVMKRGSYGEAAAISAAVTAIGGSTLTSMGVAMVGAIILFAIPILRGLIYFFYHLRMKVSDFFDVQADLIQMNALSVENNEIIDPEKRQEIVKKQMKIANKFRNIANKFNVTSKKAEVEAARENKENSKKFKIGDVAGNTSSVLF